MRTNRETRTTFRRAGGLLMAGLLATGPWGCTDYILETTVHPDGSGLRVERVEVGDNENVERSEAEYRTLMHFTPAEGWSTPRPGVNGNGDSVRVMERRMEVPDLASWSTISGTFRIDGVPPTRASERVGYVTLGNVRYHNAVQVGRGQTSDGTTTLTYRETFQADEVVDALVEFLVSLLDRSVAGAYPRLRGEERGQIVGAFRARLWTEFRTPGGLLTCSGDACEDEAQIAAIARDVADPGAKVIAARYPGESAEALEQIVERVFDDDVTAPFSRLLPGVDLSWNSHVEFRLNLPGQVLESNADRVEGSTLVWEFGPDEAIDGPVEIRAESVVRR